MKDKIEEIYMDTLQLTDDEWVAKYGEGNGYQEAFTTLIQEERKDAVEGLLNKCCNKCRDLIYSNYALQGQEKKKRSVEKLVREK